MTRKTARNILTPEQITERAKRRDIAAQGRARRLALGFSNRKAERQATAQARRDHRQLVRLEEGNR